MQVGKIVQVTENWSGAPDVCLGRFGVVIPLAVFDEYEDVNSFSGNVVAFNYPGIEDVDGDCWIFADEECEVASPEVLNEDLYSDLSEHYERFVQEFPQYFKNCPKELPARRPVVECAPEGSVQDLWKEFDKVMEEYSSFIDQVDEILSKTPALKARAELIVRRLKEIQEI